jgi:hypothetical protein
VRHWLIIAFYAVLPHCALSQSYPFIGARSNGLGNASSTLSEEWSVFNNPAGAAANTRAIAAMTYDAVPLFKSFNRLAVVFSAPLFKGGVQAGIFRSGDNLFNEQKVAVSYANKLGISSLGVTVQYVQYHAEGFGSKGVPTICAGGITELTKWLSIGAYIVNLTQPEIADGEKLPTYLILGASVKPSDNILVVAEAEKNIDEEVIIKAGLEYQFNRKFSFRTGLHPSPAAGFFGFGFHTQKIGIDYAFSYMPDVANHHQCAISYFFPSKK